MVVAVLAVVVLAAGCGSSKSDADKVKEVVTGFLGNVADGKGDAACAVLTGDAVRSLSGAAFLLRAPASCPDAIKTINKELSSDEKKALKSAKVNKVTVNRDRATVADNDIQIELSGRTALFRNNDPRPLELQKVGDNWRIASLG